TFVVREDWRRTSWALRECSGVRDEAGNRMWSGRCSSRAPARLMAGAACRSLRDPDAGPPGGATSAETARLLDWGAAFVYAGLAPLLRLMRGAGGSRSFGVEWKGMTDAGTERPDDALAVAGGARHGAHEPLPALPELLRRRA